MKKIKRIIKDNDSIIVIRAKKRFYTKVQKDNKFCTTRGALPFNEIIGKEYGIRVNDFCVLKPTLEDYILHGLKRKTQIIYPKEAGQIIVKLDLKNGDKVFECGTGSGALSLYMTRAIGPEGVLHTYEQDEKFLKNAKNNIEQYGEYKNIKYHHQNFDDDIKEKDFDSAFIDIREPQLYLEKIKSIIKPSAPIVILVPTSNQIIAVLKRLERLFKDIEIQEIIIRNFIPNPARLRPKDIMVGHTGYLIIAR